MKTSCISYPGSWFQDLVVGRNYTKMKSIFDWSFPTKYRLMQNSTYQNIIINEIKQYKSNGS